MNKLLSKDQSSIIALLESMAKASTDVKIDVQTNHDTDSIKAHFFFSFVNNAPSTEQSAGTLIINGQQYDNVQRAGVHMETRPSLDKGCNPVNQLLVHLQFELLGGRYTETITLSDFEDIQNYVESTTAALFNV